MFRRDIEGLRALAVGFVILFHAKFLGLTGGFIGVDVFFVVSGFLITSLLITEHSSLGEISLKNFYARRARRLLPASALVIALTALASRIWLEPLRLKDIGTDAVASGGFFANILFGVRSTDYLQAGQPPSPFQHFWSLSVEEQFYIVWPALLMLLLWKSRDRHTRAIVAVSILSVASLALCIWQTTQSQPWAFFGLHTRAWELGIGALVALCWKYVEQLPTNFRAVIGWLGLFAIVVSGLTITEKMAFPGKLALLPVVATALVLMAGQRSHWGPQRILSLQPLQWIGARSYSIYLWHWPVLIIAESHAERALSITERLIAITGAVIAASLSHHFLENPVRHSVSLQAKPRLALMAGAVFIVLSVGVGFVLRSSTVALSTDVIADAPIAIASTTTSTTAPVVSTDSTVAPVETTTSLITIPEGPPPSIVNPTAPIEAVIAGALTDEVPANLQPSLRGATGDKPEIYDNGCHVNLISIEPKICEYGDTTSDFTVALYGDSHAAQWFPALNQIAIDHQWRLIILTKMGCTAIDLITANSLVGPTYPGCRPWREKVLERFVAENVRVVLITNSNRLTDPSTGQPFADSIVKTGYATFIPQLQSMGINPVVITDTPYPGTDVPICLSKAIKNVGSCAVTRDKGIRANRQQTSIDVAIENNAQYLDVSHWVCTNDMCPVITGNILMYRDSHHLTTTYVQFLTPLIDAAISPYVDGVKLRISAS
ncbi:MAG: acyltransferase family protein [Actinomycetota bacterium]|nr:acyltransferase family protein [Actinomycetota bacterium]